MTATSLSSGRFTAGVVDCYMAPRILQIKPPVVFCHGAGPTADASQLVGANNTLDAIRAQMAELAAAGYAVVSFTAPDSWGSATSRSRITDALAWARANLGASSAPAVLVGASMGGVVALRYAYTNRADVACVVGFIPVVDVDDARDNDLFSTRAAIDAAWGVTWSAPGTTALPSGANPADNSASFARLPMQFWHATDDPVARPVPLTTFARATGAEVHSVGALNHTNAAIAAVDSASLVSFVRSNT